MRTSVIVPTINHRPDLLAACTDSIRPTLTDDDELFVVEGGTFAQNCNRGASWSSGDVLIFVNDDCKIDQGDWLEKLIIPFIDPQVAVVGCRLMYPNGHLQHTGVTFEIIDGLLHGVNRTHDVPSGEVSAVTAACMAVRRNVFTNLGGFDTDFRNGNEDVDFCLRARSQGHLVWYTADCTLIHHESQSGDARWAHVSDNIRVLNERWQVI